MDKLFSSIGHRLSLILSAILGWGRKVTTLVVKWLVRGINGMSLISLLTSSLVIVALLQATNYFTSEASLELSIWGETRQYQPDLLTQFYRDNELEFPDVFHDKRIRKLFSDSSIFPDSYIMVADGTSDIEVLQALKNGQKVGWYLKRRITQLEQHLEESTFVKHIYRFNESISIIPKDGIPLLINFIEKNTSKEEYYTFLIALISARVIDQNVMVRNDSEVDLKDIVIIIPAPVSKLTEVRIGSILGFSIIGNLIYDVDEKEDRLIWRIPSLPKGEHLNLKVTSRDTQLKQSELSSLFQSDKRLEKSTIYWSIPIAFMLLLILRALFSSILNKIFGRIE